MKQFERIMVCVDTPQRDERMLEYVQTIAKMSPASAIHLVHVSEEGWNGPDSDTQEQKDGLSILSQLESMGERLFGNLSGAKVSCKVITGSPLVEILEYSMDKELDLIAIGRHFGRQADKGDKALAARRLAMKAPCSVLVIPEDCEPSFTSILVPVRDSKVSSMALEAACDFAETVGGKVEALNVYEVSSGYSRVGMSRKEHAQKIGLHAIEECKELVAKTETGKIEVVPRCVPDFDGDPSDIILNRQGSAGANFVVIGARGRTGAAGVLLGSITEQLIKRSSVPVLAVKTKGETMNLLKALIELMKL